MAAEPAREPAAPGAEVLPARSGGELAGIAITLDRHPDPADPDPWIGLLMMDARLHRSGYGRQLAGPVEGRLRAAGRTAGSRPFRTAIRRRSPSGPNSAIGSSTGAKTVNSDGPAQ
ncbi:hypothetical protein GCM10020367_29360 [Streptomyces sannanensis]|uniref:GNAT family N-acetyltransferase n=1 Tax=Streptomyces sannanensis TaxID=285536 RepID=A0ABP6SBP2_9ACTN